ncbi:helix-turn-helix domain-containing protein [Paenibacillus cremeus]|uniref:helix-turn-helix domain-containing protein n=1 Tax=Paenibacillus cremeus TaxID=2163881 RepID=UPI0016484E22|nr:helix-turn-helix domain-containing protein [Paenibacillus cremeus]
MAENHNNPASNPVYSSPGILVAGHFNEPFGYATVRPRGTRDWLLTFTISGQGEYRLDGRTITCREGDVIVLPPGTPHHYYTPEGYRWEFYWVHFIPEPEWSDLLRTPSGSESTHPLLQFQVEHKLTFERILTAFQRLLQYSLDKASDYFQRRLTLGAMEEILLLLARMSQQPVHMDPRIEEVLQYLSSHLKETHTIESLARRVLLSPSRLSHLFREQTGDAVMDTLLQLRLRHAARLLEHTTLLVAEVAEEVGFRSPFYFTKQFTAAFGDNPTTYRSKREPSK